MTTDPATIAVVNKPVCALASGAMPARQAYNAVLAGAGAFPRDGFDQKIVSEVMRRTGSIIAKEAVRQLPSTARKSGVTGKMGSVRVNSGGRRNIKKKKRF